MPALDLALGLGMLRYASGMLDALLIEPFGQIAGDYSWIRCPTAAAGLWTSLARSQPDALSASSRVSVTSSARIVVQSFQAMI